MGRLCYPTQHPVSVLVPRASGAENCHGARRVWRTFCRLGTKFDRRLRVSRYKVDQATNLSPVNKVAIEALAQCRGTSLIGARNLSRCRIFIVSRCACPGAGHSQICLECRSKSKKCDKQLTHIVRVSFSFHLFVS